MHHVQFMGSDDLYETEAELLAAYETRLQSGRDPGTDWYEQTRVLTEAYGRLLGVTRKLNRAADIQQAWLIEVRNQLKARNEDLQRSSSIDGLTGLLNRAALDRVLREEVDRSERLEIPAVLILLDIDWFKTINDTRGHLAGDEALKLFARVLKERIRTSDFAGRWGGDEFLVLLPLTRLTDGLRVAQDILRGLRDASAGPDPLTASAGVAEWTPGLGLTRWLDLADRGLYRAKEQGRNRVATPTAVPAEGFGN
jgi:diguanylate cyclase (GGDEF)-like protein